LRIALSPHQVVMVRFSRGLKPRVADGGWRATGEPLTLAIWGRPIDTLREMLEEQSGSKMSATVILSNHFVQYQVLSWSAEIVTEAEELGYARARFVEIYGEAARDWIIRTSGAAGASRLAAAMDPALIHALTRTLDASGVTLTSCQPALMAQFNGARSRIGNNAWLVSAEHTRLSIARIRDGQWSSVRTRAINGAPLALRELLDQERLLLPAGTPSDQIFLSVVDGVAIDTDGLQLERLAARRNPALAADVDAGVALAMAGLH